MKERPECESAFAKDLEEWIVNEPSIVECITEEVIVQFKRKFHSIKNKHGKRIFIQTFIILRKMRENFEPDKNEFESVSKKEKSSQELCDGFALGIERSRNGPFYFNTISGKS